MSALVAFVALVFLAVMSLAVDRKLSHRERLTMNWGMDGRPGWSLPRRKALAFAPLLAALCLGAALLLAPPAHRLAVTSILAAAFAGGHVLHLALLLREE